METAYLAGYFDADGYVGINHRWTLALTVAGADPVPIRAYQERWGGSVTYQGPRQEGWVGMWYWHASGRSSVETALRAMLPYLVVKRRQARLALRFLRIPSKQGQRSPYQLRKQWYSDKIKSLKLASLRRGRKRSTS